VKKTLAEQIQRVLETLAIAESQAATVHAVMREQRIFFGLDYDYLEDDIAHLKGKVRYMQLLAQHRHTGDRSSGRVEEAGQPAYRVGL
jgi:hypothetical protein